MSRIKSECRWLLFCPHSSAKIRGKASWPDVIAPGLPTPVGLYFGRAGKGHSGWQVPMVNPPTPKQQPHGRLQMSPVVQGLPHALTAFVPVRNWRTDIALAERTPKNMVANKIFLTIVCSPIFGSIQAWRWGRWAVRLAIASGAKRVIAKAWPGTHNRAVAGAPAGQKSYGGLSQLTGR